MITQELEKPEVVDYHEQFDKISATMLKDFNASPEAYHGWYVARDRERPKPTKEMDVGSVVHSVFLEQKPLNEVAGPYPDFCLNKNGGLIGPKAEMFLEYLAGNREVTEIPKEHTTPSGALSTKQATKDWVKTLPANTKLVSPEMFAQLINTDVGEYVLKQDDIDRCNDIINKLRSTDDVKDWIDNPAMIREVPGYWIEPDFPDLQFRYKPDFVAPTQSRAFLFDLKVTAFWADLERYAKNRNAALSHAHYMSGTYHMYHPNPRREPTADILSDIMDFVRFVYVAINPEWPHEVATWECPRNEIIDAFQKRDNVLRDLITATQTDEWRHPRSRQLNQLSFY